jgi:hypothetical protein
MAIFLAGCASVGETRRHLPEPTNDLLVLHDDVGEVGEVESGHQPWRLEDWIVAGVALRSVVAVEEAATSPTEAERLVLVASLRDVRGREVRFYERSLDKPFGTIERAVARIAVVQVSGGVWEPSEVRIRKR